MKVKLFLSIMFGFLALTGCTQTKPVEVASTVVADASVAAPALATAQGVSYAGTAVGLLTGVSNGEGYERKLNAKVSLSYDAALNTISGNYIADFISGRGNKVIVTGTLAPTSIAKQSFSGMADVTPPQNTPVKYKTQTGSYSGTLGANNSTIAGVIVIEGTYTDLQGSGTFTYRLDYSALVTAPK